VGVASDILKSPFNLFRKEKKTFSFYDACEFFGNQGINSKNIALSKEIEEENFQ
jgi:hypothetical protein